MSRQLDAAITSAATSIKVSPIFTRTDFPETGIIQIEDEIIKYENTSGDEFLSCTRGYLGSSAADHAKDVEVALYGETPTNSESNTLVLLVSPQSIPSDIVDVADIIVIETVALDALVLTVASPSNTTEGRVLSVCHKAGSLGTLSINGLDLAENQATQLTWDGSAWSSAPASSVGGSSEIFLNADTKLYFREDLNAWINFNTSWGALIMSSDASNNLSIASPTNMFLQANVGVNGTGDGGVEINLRSDSDQILFYTGATINAKIDSSVSAGGTRFFLYDVDTSSLQRVSVGAADSGGTGYKVLRIPN